METLSWARAILKRCRTQAEFETARKEVEDMIMQLSTGAAVSFKKRIQFIEEI